MTEPSTPQDPSSSVPPSAARQPPSPNFDKEPQQNSEFSGNYGPPMGGPPEHSSQPAYPQPGYQQPGYQQPGYQQPAYAGPPQGMPMGPRPFSQLVGRELTSDEATWSMLSHLGGIVLGFLAPLIVMLTKGNESQYTKYHSVEALNFQITLIIAYVVSFILMFVLVGFLLLPILYIANIVYSVMAGMAANKGETYKYPFTLRLVK